LNLKFEIEVLCKALDVDIMSISKEGVLKSADLMPARQQLNDLVELRQPSALNASGGQMAPTAIAGGVFGGGPFGSSPLPGAVHMGGAGTPAQHMHSSASASALLAPISGVCARVHTCTHIVYTEAATVAPPTLKFEYAQIDTNMISATIAQFLTVNEQLTLFRVYPHLKVRTFELQIVSNKYFRCKFNRPSKMCCTTCSHPLLKGRLRYTVFIGVQLNVQVAMTTTEHIVTKDFAVGMHDELTMLTCARHMMRSLTAGMAMITCQVRHLMCMFSRYVCVNRTYYNTT
jgi:hypothetical protein